MRNRWARRCMALCMLLSIYLLSREGAICTAKMGTETKGRIIIDSGHGGIDPGVVGIGGLQEKEVNLEIARYLEKELKKEGYEVLLTRESDKGLYDEAAGIRRFRICRTAVL